MQRVQCKRCRVVYRVGYPGSRKSESARCEVPSCRVPYMEIYRGNEMFSFIARSAAKLDQMREYHGPETQPTDGC